MIHYMIIQAVSRGFAIAILVLSFALIYKYLKNDSTKKKELPEKGNTEKNGNLKGNPTSELNDRFHEFSLLQYKARMQQWTGIAQTEWQIETISVAVTAGVLAAAFGYIREPLALRFRSGIWCSYGFQPCGSDFQEPFNWKNASRVHKEN